MLSICARIAAASAARLSWVSVEAASVELRAGLIAPKIPTPKANENRHKARVRRVIVVEPPSKKLPESIDRMCAKRHDGLRAPCVKADLIYPALVSRM